MLTGRSGKRQRETKLRVILIAVMVLVLSLAQIAPVLAASQAWYLTDIASGSNYVMQKGSSGGGGTSIIISGGASRNFLADEAATTNVGFQEGSWTGQITRTGVDQARTATVEVGVWSGTTFASYGSGDASLGSKIMTISFTISASAFDVPEGQRLALRFVNTSSPAGKLIDVSTAGDSYLTSPPSDPGYPIPDVGAMLMFAAGLGVVAWVILRLRKTANVSTA